MDLFTQIELYLPTWLDNNPLVLVVPILIWWLKREWDLLGSPGNKAIEDRIARLRKKTIAEAYHARLAYLLAWVDKYFGSEGLARPGSWVDRLFGSQPYTALAFERLFLLAVIYPLLFLVLGWLLGNQGKLGELQVLDPTDLVRRLIVVPAFGFVAFAMSRFITTGGWRSLPWLAVTGAFAGVSAVAGAGAAAPVLAVAGAGAAAPVFAGGGAHVFDDVAAVAIPVFFAVIVAFRHFQTRAVAANHLGQFWVFAWLVLVLYLSMASYFVVTFGAKVTVAPALIILLFFGVLPLFNAPLDWLSFGVTRGLLRAIASGMHGWLISLLFALLDFVVALVFLAAVALSTLAGLWVVNTIASTAGVSPIIDLPTLWAQLIVGGWRENLWIWLMLGSTLIPTAVHFLVALYALSLLFSPARARKAADEIAISRKEYLRRVADDTQQNAGDVSVHADARLYAFLHLVLGQILVTGFWLFGVAILGYLLFNHVPVWIEAFLAWVGHLMGSYWT